MRQSRTLVVGCTRDGCNATRTLTIVGFDSEPISDDEARIIFGEGVSSALLRRSFSADEGSWSSRCVGDGGKHLPKLMLR